MSVRLQVRDRATTLHVKRTRCGGPRVGGESGEAPPFDGLKKKVVTAGEGQFPL